MLLLAIIDTKKIILPVLGFSSESIRKKTGGQPNGWKWVTRTTK